MMSPKANMAFAALLCAGLIAMLSGFMAKKAVSPEVLAEDAVKVEAIETAAGGSAPAAAAMPEPILAMIATADVARGQAVAKACAACHNFDKGGANGVGPALWGVVGAQKQAHAGYAYSGSLTEKGGTTWTYAELNKFLWKPKAYAAGTKMSFVGIKKADDRAAVIAYLRSLNNAPAPSAAEIAAETAELAPAPAAAVPAPAATTPAAAPAPAPAAAH